MKLYFLEIKKIWSWKILLVVAAIVMLLFSFNLVSYIRYFPNGHPATEIFSNTEELRNLYGTQVADEERMSFYKQKETEILVEVNQWIEKRGLEVLGITNVDQFIDFYNEESHTSGEYDSIIDDFLNNNHFLGFRLQAIRWSIENFQSFLSKIEQEPQKLTPLEKEVVKTKQYQSVMDIYIIDNFKGYASDLTALIMICILVFLAPVITMDHSQRLHHLQYSSLFGRKTIGKIFFAQIVSAILLTTLLLSIFAIIFSQTGTIKYWNHKINSVETLRFYRGNLTFGDFILNHIFIIYSFSIASCCLAFVVSRFSSSLISLIMKIVPLIYILNYLIGVVLRFFMVEGAGTHAWLPVPHSEIIVTVMIALISLFLAGITIYRERSIDVK